MSLPIILFDILREEDITSDKDYKTLYKDVRVKMQSSFSLKSGGFGEQQTGNSLAYLPKISDLAKGDILSNSTKQYKITDLLGVRTAYTVVKIERIG